jgi:GNAT superfamily N-acetyltransferase
VAAFTHRVATIEDLDALREVMRRSIATLQTGFLTPEQVRVSHTVMGLDSQLVRDGTYFVVESGARIAGCGGWSWRSTLYGGDDSMVSRIRAMYTDPDFARQGVGRIVITLCEEAAMRAGFRRATMMATMAGVPLYEACGYVQVEPVLSAPVDGIRVPLVRMEKRLD